MQSEILGYVVNYDGLCQLATDSGQILDIISLEWKGVLPIKPVRNAADIFHELERPVSVLFRSCSEYDYLEVRGHKLQEGVSAWTYRQLTLIVVELLE